MKEKKEKKELTNEELIILLLGACDNKPIPSIEHLKAELFLIKKVLQEKK